MSKTHAHTITYTMAPDTEDTQTNAVSVTKTADNANNLSVAVADSATDDQHTYDIDVSLVESIYWVSDQTVTIETNDGTTPAQTITLTANQPLVWHDTMVFSNPLTVDITDVFVTNNSGSTANVKLYTLLNSA